MLLDGTCFSSQCSAVAQLPSEQNRECTVRALRRCLLFPLVLHPWAVCTNQQQKSSASRLFMRLFT